jgi:hypothetical protein
VGLLAVGVASVGGVALVGSGSGSAGAERQPAAALSPREVRAFDEFPLYDAGERVDGLPLVAVLRRDDTAKYVSFVYGDCLAGDERGCAPPAEIQVWPACRRTLALYDLAASGAPALENATIRGVPAAFVDGGTQLELETDGATVVVFAGSRAQAIRIAKALRSVDGAVAAGEPLPRRESAHERGGAAMDC